MKILKSNPTSYKDFLEQFGKAKTTKPANQFKIKNTPKANNSSMSNLHSQSTCLWEKRSPSQARLATEVSAQKRIKSHNQSTQLENKPKGTSKKDKMLCYHRFITQATTILTQIFKSPAPQLLNNRISYIQYLQALKSLKMIHENYEPYPNDIVSELWSEYISGYNVGNFIITLTSILGLYDGKQNEDDRYLKYKYQSLKYTRMELHKTFGHEHAKENQCTFTPQISQRSRKLISSASKNKKTHKNNPLQSINTDRCLTDRINGSMICYDKSRTSMQEYNDENFYANNTEPTIEYKPDHSGNLRSQILYEKAKQKSTGKRSNKTSEDIEYQKSMGQLTFKPKILKIKAKEKQQIIKCSVKGQKNTISRMIRGRVERQVRKIINEKGVPYNEKLVDKMRKEKYQEITSVINLQNIEQRQNTTQTQITHKNSLPKLMLDSRKQQNTKPNHPVPQQDLVIDVYISEDHKQKLIIRKGQSLQQVASQFIQQHGLSIQKKEQLIQLLQVSITHALCPIDELVEEQDELASARSHYKRQYFR